MGTSSDFPDIDFSASPPVPEQPQVFIPPTPAYLLRREPVWRYVILFVLTPLGIAVAWIGTRRAR